MPGYAEQPVFNWKEQFSSVLVDESLARYMQTNKLAVCIYGTGMAMKAEIPRKTVTRAKNETTPAVMPCAETQMENNVKKLKDDRSLSGNQRGQGKVDVVRNAAGEAMKNKKKSAEASGKKDNCGVF